jgi:hypothetical protein
MVAYEIAGLPANDKIALMAGRYILGKMDSKQRHYRVGSGISLATAKLFVEEGAYVFITGRSQEKLDKAIKNTYVGKAFLIQMCGGAPDYKHSPELDI